MRIRTNEEGAIILEEVFEGVTFVTEEGNRLSVTMRDDSFEVAVTCIHGDHPDGEMHPTWSGRFDMAQDGKPVQDGAS